LRFIRLWKKSGWSIDLTDRIVTTFLGMPPQDLTSGNIDAAFTALLARMANFIWLANRLSISDKKLGDWLPIWDMSQADAVRRETLAHLLRFGATDLEHLFEISGIDPVADDLDTDEPSLHRFLDARDTLKAAKLKVSDVDYLLRHQDDAGKLAPSEASLRLDLKALHDAVTAVETELSAPVETADLGYARNKMALVYDISIVDWFISLVSASKTYDAPFATTEEALPEKLTAVDTRIGFDPFAKLLTYTGVMTEDARIALANAADTLLLADMEVVTDQTDLDAYITAFKDAVQVLTDTGAADVQALADEYPELQVAYDAVVAAPGPESQALILVDEILPALRQRLKTVALRTTLAAQLKIDPPLIDVLTEEAAVLHANSDSGKAVLDDFLALETPILFDANQVYAFHLDPPATDDYILYARAPAGTSVTLSIDGAEVIPATVVDADGEVSTSAVVPLQSGLLTAVTLTLSALPSNESAELHWRTTAMAKAPIPATRLYADPQLAEARASLIRLQKAAMLLSAISLTPRELRYLATIDANTNDCLNDLNVGGTITPGLWEKFTWLAWFSGQKAEEPDENAWIELLEDPALGTLVRTIANSWSEQDLHNTLTRLGLDATDAPSLQVFRQVKEAVDFITDTNQSAADILAWTVDAPDLPLIVGIKETLRERQNEQSWRMTLQSVNDALRNQRRDALVSYILQHAAPATDIDTPDKLYEHFLIDVEMDACRKTSRIRQALSTTQLFITRCLMNLEPEVEASSIRADHWAWMKRYRVWEANRKIFLWPENWLEPELRDNKSPIFRELESDLLKSDITDELAERAYLSYLKKLDEIARLEIMGSFLQEQTSDQDDDILHVFGRTNGMAHQYYYRRYEYGYWTPWEKVNLNIQGDLLFPVIWKNQLFLFWLTAVPKPDAGDRSQMPSEMAEKPWGENAPLNVELHLSWGEYYGGEWTSPKSSELNDPILLHGLTSFEPEKLFIASRTERPDLNISERLVMTIGYLPTEVQENHGFSVVFTSKNSPPNIYTQGDLNLLLNPALFNYVLLWSHQTAIRLDSNSLRVPGNICQVTIAQPPGATSGTRSEKLLEKTGNLADDFRVRPIMHPVANQWQAPLFYSDEHSVFFIGADERVNLGFGGFYWNESDAVLVSPERIEIPELYEKPAIEDPVGPVINPLENLINPYYEQVINNNSVFVYRGTAFDANGVVTEEVVQ
jgi:hypothetical protein